MKTMKTLILPCCGANKLNGIPVYLERHPDGRYLIEKCVGGLGGYDIGRIVVTIRKKDDIQYGAAAKLAKILKDLSSVVTINVLALDKDTAGPADTVYQTVKKASVTGSILIKDTDNLVVANNAGTDTCAGTASDNFVTGVRLNDYRADLSSILSKSFIRINEQRQILDIIEKHIVSDVVCCGLYGFEDAGEFAGAYEAVTSGDKGVAGAYVSHIVAYLIGVKGRVFQYDDALEYESWETPDDWRRCWARNATYIAGQGDFFTAKSKLAIFDLDGTLFDTRQPNYLAYRDAFAAEGFRLDYGRFTRASYGKPYTVFVPELLNGSGTGDACDKARLRRIHEYKLDAYSKYLKEAVPNNHLLNMAKLLKPEYHLAIVTTASAKNCMDLTDAFGLRHVFDLVITAGDVRAAKPDPEGFIKAMRFFCVTPENTVIYEDSDTGIQAAIHSGATCFRALGFA